MKFLFLSNYIIVFVSNLNNANVIIYSHRIIIFMNYPPNHISTLFSAINFFNIIFSRHDLKTGIHTFATMPGSQNVIFVQNRSSTTIQTCYGLPGHLGRKFTPFSIIATKYFSANTKTKGFDWSFVFNKTFTK